MNEDMNTIAKHGINAYPRLCDKDSGTCPQRFDCRYLRQFHNINEYPDASISGAFQLLGTEFFRILNCDVLVIDEFVVGALNPKITFDFDDLNHLSTIVSEIRDRIPVDRASYHFFHTIYILFYQRYTNHSSMYV